MLASFRMFSETRPVAPIVQSSSKGWRREKLEGEINLCEMFNLKVAKQSLWGQVICQSSKRKACFNVCLQECQHGRGGNHAVCNGCQSIVDKPEEAK